MIHKEFLCPETNHGNCSILFKNLFNTTAATYTINMVFPKLIFTFPNTPSSNFYFFVEWIKFAFHVYSCTIFKTYRSNSSFMFCEFEFIFLIFDEWFWSLAWLLFIGWFHKNPPHALCTQVHFQKFLLVGVKSS